MWRSALLALSTNEGTRKLATRTGLGRRVASRFVAGETLDEAMSVAKDLNRGGALVELDYLGEHVTDREQAALVVITYQDMLNRIANACLDAQISLKPSQMGQELDDELCYNNFRQIAELAREHGNFVWLDMEGSQYTERTIQLYRRLRSTYDNLGIALQSYLRRCEADVRAMIAICGTVRLVKGAYNEPTDIAFPHKSDVDRNFKRLTEILLSSGQYHAIATHDEEMISHAIEFAKANGIEKQQFEFQMLYGIRRDLQTKLLRDGYRVRVYVPFGEQWYPYLMRRLAERPANLLFFATNVVAELRSAK